MLVNLGERFCTAFVEVSQTELFRWVEVYSGDGLTMEGHRMVILGRDYMITVEVYWDTKFLESVTLTHIMVLKCISLCKT